jgi:hypothetical protein
VTTHLAAAIARPSPPRASVSDKVDRGKAPPRGCAHDHARRRTRRR